MNIVITGKTGYIATSLRKFLNTKSKDIKCDQKSIQNDAISNLCLNNTDVLIHLAAIVHKKEITTSETEYYQVNTELTHQLAIKAKASGVKQFIFFSTMAVYGKTQGEINSETNLNPITFYGKSKLAAEKLLKELQDENFKVIIIRPPMVYGPRCPGNYTLLSNFSRKTFIFPKVDNKRSMIFINNLNEFVYQLIQNEESGVFHPQDAQFINTSLMVKEISKVHSKYIYFSKLTAYLMKAIIGKQPIYLKVFGDLYYDKELSTYKHNSYQKFDFAQSIKLTEKDNLK